MTARLLYVNNPAAPHVGLRIYEADRPLSAREMATAAGWRLPHDTLLVRNGQLTKWDEGGPVNDNETAVAIHWPAGGKDGGSQIFAMVAELALMIAAPQIGAFLFPALTGIAASIATVAIVIAGKLLISALLPKPKAPPQPKDQSPTYSLTAQSNQERLGAMVAECFGRFQHVPDLASQPYFDYVNDQQRLFELFDLGLGTFDVEQVSIGDTVIWKDGAYTGALPEVQIEIVPPDGVVTMFPDNVVTSQDVSGVTMLGINEDNHAKIGPFALSKPGSTVGCSNTVGCPAVASIPTQSVDGGPP